MDLAFDGYKTKCITPAKWAYLWATSSPFIVNEKEPTLLDVDYFLYVLDNGIEEGDVVLSFNRSLGYTKKLNINTYWM